MNLEKIESEIRYVEHCLIDSCLRSSTYTKDCIYW